MKITTNDGTELVLSPCELAELVELDLATVDIDLTEIEDYNIDCEDCSFSGCCDVNADDEQEEEDETFEKEVTVHELILFLLDFDSDLVCNLIKDEDGFYIIDTCLNDDMKDQG